MKKVFSKVDIKSYHGEIDTYGEIESITHERIVVDFDSTKLVFDAKTGDQLEETDNYYQCYITVSDIDVPENPFNSVDYRMREEGFHYCFNGYSNWNDIEDPKFQKLKNKYLKAAKKLEEYVSGQSDKD